MGKSNRREFNIARAERGTRGKEEILEEMKNAKPLNGYPQKSKISKGLEKVKQVSEKIKNLYNKATGRKTITAEMDGKTFKGTEKIGKRSVVKVKNPTAGSRKIVDVYTLQGNLKRSKTIDKFPDGTRKVTKSGPDKDAIYQKEQRKLMRKNRG